MFQWRNPFTPPQVGDELNKHYMLLFTSFCVYTLKLVLYAVQKRLSKLNLLIAAGFMAHL